MIESHRDWHSEVVQLRSSTLVLMPLLLVLACDAQDEGEGQPCQAPEDPVDATYTITLTGFPEIEGNKLVSSSGLDFNGPCTVEQMDLAADQLTLSLSCEHPAPSVPEGASVTITTAAAGLPAGVEIGDVLTFDASVLYFENVGGDASGPIFRGLEEAGPEHYRLSDVDGIVFGARLDGLDANFEPISVTRKYNCPGWMPCSGESMGPVAAYVHASTGESELDVHVGEVALLESGEMAWDLSLFSASVGDDCHGGEYGNFSVVRRPQ